MSEYIVTTLFTSLLRVANTNELMSKYSLSIDDNGLLNFDIKDFRGNDCATDNITIFNDIDRKGENFYNTTVNRDLILGKLFVYAMGCIFYDYKQYFYKSKVERDSHGTVSILAKDIKTCFQGLPIRKEKHDANINVGCFVSTFCDDMQNLKDYKKAEAFNYLIEGVKYLYKFIDNSSGDSLLYKSLQLIEPIVSIRYIKGESFLKQSENPLRCESNEFFEGFGNEIRKHIIKSISKLEEIANIEGPFEQYIAPLNSKYFGNEVNKYLPFESWRGWYNLADQYNLYKRLHHLSHPIEYLTQVPIRQCYDRSVLNYEYILFSKFRSMFNNSLCKRSWLLGNYLLATAIGDWFAKLVCHYGSRGYNFSIREDLREIDSIFSNVKYEECVNDLIISVSKENIIQDIGNFIKYFCMTGELVIKSKVVQFLTSIEGAIRFLCDFIDNRGGESELYCVLEHIALMLPRKNYQDEQLNKIKELLCDTKRLSECLTFRIKMFLKGLYRAMDMPKESKVYIAYCLQTESLESTICDALDKKYKIHLTDQYRFGWNFWFFNLDNGGEFRTNICLKLLEAEVLGSKSTSSEGKSEVSAEHAIVPVIADKAEMVNSELTSRPDDNAEVSAEHAIDSVAANKDEIVNSKLTSHADNNIGVALRKTLDLNLTNESLLERGDLVIACIDVNFS